MDVIFNNHKRMRMLLVAIILSIVVVLTAYANTFNMSWCKYDGVTCSDTTIDTWHKEGTKHLCRDVDGPGDDLDVAVSTAIKRPDAVDANWTCFGGSANPTEVNILFMAANMWGSYDGCAVTSMTINGSACPGCYEPVNQAIFVKATAENGTLVHEVGHRAGLSDVNSTNEPGAETDRIMWYSTAGAEERVINDSTVNGDEEVAYEAL
ncbi:MAG TPA: hypothetical protein VMX13_08980 [Sedimentisphaerales bacterium]|nr:hypothetical protein [Sedimentisphaerales bacterium]